MNSTASSLQELHKLHQQLQGFEESLSRGPKQIRAREQAVERKRAELDEQKQQLRQLQMAADQKSLQLKSNENKITDLRAKLNQAASNREYDILRTQIDADTMANSVLEDEILEALEKVDAMQARLKQTEKEIADGEAVRKRTADEVAAAAPGQQARAAELRESLSEAEKHLPSTIVDQYRRLVNAYGAGAMAAVVNRACTSCYAILSPQLLVEVKSGKPTFCRDCGRLLYPGDE